MKKRTTTTRYKRGKMIPRQALEYVLDILCYAYYVKDDNIVSDQVFDELEKFYCKLTGLDTAPMRGVEIDNKYSMGVKVTYDYYKEKKEEEK